MNKIILLLFLFMSFNLYSETGAITGLDIPRFVSLKSNDVNLRVGPSKNYPIEIKYTKKNLPIEIIDELPLIPSAIFKLLIKSRIKKGVRNIDIFSIS